MNTKIRGDVEQPIISSMHRLLTITSITMLAESGFAAIVLVEPSRTIFQNTIQSTNIPAFSTNLLASTNLPSLVLSTNSLFSTNVSSLSVTTNLPIEPVPDQPLSPGLYKSSPYSMLVMVPQSVDPNMQSGAGQVLPFDKNQSWIKPELRLEKR